MLLNPPPVAPHPKGRLESIDALRGIAALAVLGFHARAMYWVGLRDTWRDNALRFNPDAWLGYLSTPFAFGSLGVTLFFVLSGYCIHRPYAQRLARDPGAAAGWGTFALRRLWRIYPTYVAALLLTAAVDHVLMLVAPVTVRGPAYDDSPFAFVINLLGLQGLAAPIFGCNVVLWTLALEIHLYLVYPILYALTRRYGPRVALLVPLVSQVAVSVLVALTPLWDYFPYRWAGEPLFLLFWFTWAIGMYLADVEAGRATLPRAWPVLAMAAWPAALACAILHWPGADLLWAVAFAGLVYASISPAGQRLWARGVGPLFALVGTFSYSLYAVHVPLLLMARTVLQPDGQKSVSVGPALTAAVLALAGAGVFFLVVERWTLRPLVRRSALAPATATV